MGDIRDMMEEGILCQCCGVYLEADEKSQPKGVPDTCGDCLEDMKASRKKRRR